MTYIIHLYFLHRWRVIVNFVKMWSTKNKKRKKYALKLRFCLIRTFYVYLYKTRVILNLLLDYLIGVSAT